MTAARPDNPNERRIHNRNLAIRLAEAGLYVFPSRHKVPRVLDWQRADTSMSAEDVAEARARARKEAADEGRRFDDDQYVGATIDVETVKKLWRKYPDAVPSISLGPSKLYVLDCDIDEKRNGPELMSAWLKASGVDTFACPMTRSRRGGLHIFFQGDQLRSHVGPTLKKMYVQAKARGGQVIAPGAWREDGKRYAPIAGQPPLAEAYAKHDLPSVAAPLIKLQSERSASSDVPDGEVADAIDAMGGDLPEIDFDPNDFVRVSGDHSTDRFALALDLTRSHGEHFLPALYRAAIEAFDAAGEFVDRRPGEGEYDLRALGREFVKAKARVAREAVEAIEAAERIAAISAEAFGDVSDSSIAACHAIVAALERGEDPSPEIERGRLALESADDVTADLEMAFRELDDAFALDDGLPAAIGRLKTAMGCSTGKTALSDHEPAHYLEAKAAKASKNSALAWEDQHASAELIHTHRAEPLVADVLECGAISVVYGNSNAGKSFVVAGLGYAVASGLPWHLHATTKGAVVYIGLEGRSGFRRRVAAIRSDTAPHSPNPAIFATTQVEGVNLTADGSDATRIVATIGEVESAGGHPVRLVVIDTLAAVIAGSDENSGRDMGAFVREIKKIAAAYPRVHILIVHHTGKDQARGARGHSSLRAAVDTEIEVTPGEIRVTKQRDLHFVPSIGFRLEPVYLGEDDAGRPLRTAIVRLHSIRGASTGEAFGSIKDDDDVDFVRGTLSPDQRSVFDAAVKAIDAANGEPVAPAAIITELAKVCPAMKSNTIRTTITRKLIPCGLIERVGDNYRLSKRFDTTVSDG